METWPAEDDGLCDCCGDEVNDDGDCGNCEKCRECGEKFETMYTPKPDKSFDWLCEKCLAKAMEESK